MEFNWDHIALQLLSPNFLGDHAHSFQVSSYLDQERESHLASGSSESFANLTFVENFCDLYDLFLIHFVVCVCVTLHSLVFLWGFAFKSLFSFEGEIVAAFPFPDFSVSSPLSLSLSELSSSSVFLSKLLVWCRVFLPGLFLRRGNPSGLVPGVPFAFK